MDDEMDGMDYQYSQQPQESSSTHQMTTQFVGYQQQPQQQQQQQHQQQRRSLCPALQDYGPYAGPRHYNPHVSQGAHDRQGVGRIHTGYPFDPVHHSSGPPLPWHSQAPQSPTYNPWVGDHQSYTANLGQAMPFSLPYPSSTNQDNVGAGTASAAATGNARLDVNQSSRNGYPVVQRVRGQTVLPPLPQPHLYPAPAPARASAPRMAARPAFQTGQARLQHDAATPEPISRRSDGSDFDSEEDDLSDPYADDLAQHYLGGHTNTRTDRAGAVTESRVRMHQLIRGQLSNKRIASRGAIASLQSVDIATLPETERACIICYNDFGVENPEGVAEDPLRLPKCKHIFGDHCIKKWLADSDTCPYCRDKLPSELQSRARMGDSQALRDIIARHDSQLRAHRQDQNPPHPMMPLEADMLSRYVTMSGRLDTSSPRAWTGERRSPPSESPEVERRRVARPRRGAIRASPSSTVTSQSQTQYQIPTHHQHQAHGQGQIQSLGQAGASFGGGSGSSLSVQTQAQTQTQVQSSMSANTHQRHQSHGQPISPLPLPTYQQQRWSHGPRLTTGSTPSSMSSMSSATSAEQNGQRISQQQNPQQISFYAEASPPPSNPNPAQIQGQGQSQGQDREQLYSASSDQANQHVINQASFRQTAQASVDARQHHFHSQPQQQGQHQPGQHPPSNDFSQFPPVQYQSAGPFATGVPFQHMAVSNVGVSSPSSGAHFWPGTMLHQDQMDIDGPNNYNHYPGPASSRAS